MNIKIGNIFLFLFLSFNLNSAYSGEKILIARHENWNHPVEAVFKKYGLALYKVHYSKDGTCPTFYLKFKSSIQNAVTTHYQKIYSEILKANSDYPYALINERDNLKINVGWSDAAKKNMTVNINKASSVSLCKGNNHAHIDDGANFDKFTITESMKKRILNSPFKASLRNKDGKNFIAYLYAENTLNNPNEYYNSKTKQMIKVIEKKGNYYIYLYDVDEKTFFPGRVEIFKDNYKNIMDVPGADFFSLPTANKNKSDILLVSQHGIYEESYYEAYGFTDDHSFLKKYVFFTNKKYKKFHGIINKGAEKGNFIAYEDLISEMKKMYLSLSNIPGEIKLKPAVN